MRFRHPIPTAAAALLLSSTLKLLAGTSTWNVNANGSWGIAGNWDVAPAFDGTDAIVLGTKILAHRDLTLDGNRSVTNLSVTSGWTYTLKPGNTPGSTVILRSGNLTTDGMNVSYAYALNASAVTLQIGDGVTPVTGAVWSFSNAHINRRPPTIGGIRGIAGTVVTTTGNNYVLFAGANALTCLANFNLGGGYAQVSGNSALGAGTVTPQASYPGIVFITSSTAHETTFNCAYAARLAVADNLTVTLNGPLTGAGTLRLGDNGATGSTVYNGILVVAGTGNTLSGDVTAIGGRLRVDGVMSGAGNITVAADYTTEPWLEGSGTIGMGSGKIVTIRGRFYNSINRFKTLAPGTDGTTGTLTVGTPGNQNKVLFDTVTRLKCDLSGATAGLSDRLAVRGTLEIKIGVVDQELRLTRIGGTKLNGTYTLATYDTLVGTFDRVYLNDALVTDPTARKGVGGTHQLVYGATSLQLVAAPAGGTLLLVN